MISETGDSDESKAVRLINFNVTLRKEGIVRLVNHFPDGSRNGYTHK